MFPGELRRLLRVRPYGRPWSTDRIQTLGAVVPASRVSPADRAVIEAALRLVLEGGLLQNQIARRVDLDDIVAAHKAVESGQLVGNPVVRLPAAVNSRPCKIP